MTNKEILSHVDHTLLKAFATWEQIKTLCNEAIDNGCASVCVPPSYVKRIKDEFGDKLDICTVIGFPLGYETTAGKVADAVKCIEDGAVEIDMVVNVAEVKNGNFEYVENEIKALREATKGNVLKVIIETCYLEKDEKIALCKAVTNAGADYIKTSTGFGSAGATLEDIALFKANIGPNVKMKAAGGITTVDEVVAYLEAGCDRIGTSRAVALLK